MDRRGFLKTVASVGIPLGVGAFQKPIQVMADDVKYKSLLIKNTKEPLALAMWDFSWLQRHHKGGEYENWDKVLDEMVERGYNALRMEVYPHLVAADTDGKITEQFYFPRDKWGPILWGNNLSMYACPRRALLEFIPKCKKRGIKLGLSTWFLGESTKRNERIKGLDGLVRVWDETLTFLADNSLLDSTIYVDLLNEYPRFNGFCQGKGWFKTQMDKRERADKTVAENSDQQKREAHIWLPQRGQKYNEVQKNFYRDFMTRALKQLSEKWPGLNFMASQTAHWDVPWTDMDFTEYDILDIHIWFIGLVDKRFANSTDYWKQMHWSSGDKGFEKCYEEIHKYWNAHKADLIKKMEEMISEVAVVGKRYSIPYGNTEGWGPINWMDHPLLDWDFVKEAGEICVRLGAKYGYAYNCSSNFTGPQFKGIWKDIEWHRKVTSIIRKGC